MHRLRTTALTRLLSTEAPKQQSSSSHKLPFTIPDAIERSPTDLLKALSKTVGVDPTAPHFAFIDDPAMIPTTAAAKKSYYLAKELGKRAARTLVEEWPTLFMFDRDEPRLDTFRPQKVMSPLEVEPTEENLAEMVRAKRVTDALQLYEKMRTDDKDVSSDLQLDLFRLVVYYNGQDVPFGEIEEWHGMRNFYSDEDQGWRGDEDADLLFEIMEKTEEVYSTMIAGLCKYHTNLSFARAKGLLHEMLEKNMTPHEDAINHLISCGIAEDVEDRLKFMFQHNIKPTVRTLNASLMATNKATSNKLARMRMLIGEMMALGVKPNLTTYDLVLNAVRPEMTQRMDDEQHKKIARAVTVLDEILKALEAEPFINSSEPTDQKFFITAMSVAVQAANGDMADRVETLYTDKKNQVQLTAFTDESMFYGRYLSFKVKRLPIDEVDKVYKSLVPRLTGVNRYLIRIVYDRLLRDPHWALTRRLIEDGIASRSATDDEISRRFRELLLSINTKNMPLNEVEQYEELVKRIVDIWVEFSEFTEERVRRLQHKFNPASLCDCALLLLRANHVDRAWRLLALLLNPDNVKGESATIGMTHTQPSSDVLRDLMDEATKRGDWFNACVVLQLMETYQPKIDLNRMVVAIENLCQLNPMQKRLLYNHIRLRPYNVNI